MLKDLFEEPIVLDIAPEKEEEVIMPLAAATEKKIVRKDTFLLRKAKDQNMLEVILDQDLVGKCVKVLYFDDVLEFESAPEELYIKTSKDLDVIDIEKLAQHIRVEPC